MPKVSITATVLNEARDIDALIDTLMHQTLVPSEVIVVDGGSADGTWEKLQNAKTKYPSLIAIRDETCNLKRSAGPIARGRNIAISAATSEIIACADAGCTYRSDWLENLVGPILRNESSYALGGSCLDPSELTVWDLACAPFFGIKLSPQRTTKSCTARSMAFCKSLWQQIGGFPETVFLGEDTMFDAAARRLVTPAFSPEAKAFYAPRHSLASALRQLASYAVTDGVLGVRPMRLVRNLSRCVAEIVSVLALKWTALPLAVVLMLELCFAFRLDWTDLRSRPFRVLAARLLFSLSVPWVVTWNQIAGNLHKAYQPNRQNIPQNG
jgi:glycosyltransferase involved in cell wall biosynthesis